MPLNHIMGERLEGMSPHYRVVDVAKYKNLPRLTTLVKEWVGKQFKTEKDVYRPIWEAALGHAQIAYFNAGAAPPLRYDVIAQEYVTGEVAFVFHARVNGEDLYVPAVFALAPQQIADLTLTGDWKPFKVH